MWVLDLLPLLGPLIFLLFSLSPPDASLSLSLGYYRGQSPSIHNSSKKTSSKTHNKKNPKSKPIKLNQQEHDKTKKKKERPTEEKTETHML
jgi:hypothetical protein